MLILCRSCHSWRDWRKQQHERIGEQRCECGGRYKRLVCFKECKYLDFARCKAEGYCIKRMEGKK